MSSNRMFRVHITRFQSCVVEVLAEDESDAEYEAYNMDLEFYDLEDSIEVQEIL